jgi:4-diphosphocytidyl-2-C-methyl-D-erythritol kinase
MAAHWEMSPDDPILCKIAAELGQDVPCCIAAQSCYFQGVGDKVMRGPDLPYTDMVLINPMKSVPTPSVFKARSGDFSLPATKRFDGCENAAVLAQRLGAARNDLTDAAISLCPEIGDVLSLLGEQEGLLLARMSGSGATCFGLFEDRGMAKAAAARIYAANPSYWVVPAFLPVRPPETRSVEKLNF